MRNRLLPLAAAFGVFTIALGAHGSPLAPKPAFSDKTIVHVLNRIGFGPRLGDLEAVRR